MKYLDKQDKAIANVEEMKTMFEKTKIDKEAEDTNLYSQIAMTNYTDRKEK